MVERITEESLIHSVSELKEGCLLCPSLADEIGRLVQESEHLSHWTDTARHLAAKGYEQLRASGPVSKVLRTLAFLLERMSESRDDMDARGLQITRVHLLDTRSGCSDFGGRIEVQASERGGAEIMLIDGLFVWDCAVHGIPQRRAAQELGYRCMVSFPELPIPVPG
jgi:hypothetical protein